MEQMKSPPSGRYQAHSSTTIRDEPEFHSIVDVQLKLPAFDITLL
jgi:hypothetical protein